MYTLLFFPVPIVCFFRQQIFNNINNSFERRLIDGRSCTRRILMNNIIPGRLSTTITIQKYSFSKHNRSLKLSLNLTFQEEICQRTMRHHVLICMTFWNNTYYIKATKASMYHRTCVQKEASNNMLP